MLEKIEAEEKVSQILRTGCYPPPPYAMFMNSGERDSVDRVLSCFYFYFFPVLFFVRYEGEWKDDMKWGFGTAVYRKKANYEGHFFMDKRHGFGRMWYANAGTYEVRRTSVHSRRVFRSSQDQEKDNIANCTMGFVYAEQVHGAVFLRLCCKV